MTSVYEEKIYPEIPSAPPDESQNYRLKKIDEAEKFLRDEIAYREKLAKRYKRRSNATMISDTSIILAITGLENFYCNIFNRYWYTSKYSFRCSWPYFRSWINRRTQNSKNL